jgi:hypothetical protein
MMAVGKWENEARLNCNTHQFATEMFVDILSVELCGTNYQLVISSRNLFEVLAAYLPFTIHPTTP